MKRKLAAIAAAGLLASGASAQAASRTVFVCNNVSDEITTFTLNVDGTLAFIGTYATSDGPQAISLSPDGRYLAVGHGTLSDTVEAFYIYEVNSDGSLTLLLQDTVPDSPLDVQWLAPDVVAVTETSVGGDNFVRIYRFDRGFNSLLEFDTEYTGSFNTCLFLDETRSFLYANDSLANAIRVFRVNGDGSLDLLSTTSTGALYAVDVAATADGVRLYGACGISGNAHNVLGYSVDDNGALSPLSGSPYQSPGDSPAHVVPTPDGRFLFVGHGRDATIRSFAIHEEDGSLTSTGHMFDVGLQGTIGDIVILDDLLFVTDESTAIDGITGIYTFRINADGSFTMIGSIQDTQGVRPEMITTWTPHETGEIAELLDFDFPFGSLISGNLDSIRMSDNAFMRSRSEFGFSAIEPNVTELVIGAATDVSSPSSLDLAVESLLNNPGGLVRLRLKNWNTNLFEQVHQYDLGVDETVETVEDIDASNRVRFNDGRIELSIRQVVAISFSAAGFDSFFDHVEISVE